MHAKINGIEMYYEFSGPEEAPVIACSHCLAGSSGIWDAQVIPLREKFRVLRFDTRGHGSSEASEGSYTMEMLADDAFGLLEHVGIERVHFMGISMGGMIGQVLALRHPECIESLILCDTACRIPGEAAPEWDERIEAVSRHGMSAVVEGTLERWLSPDFQTNSPATTERIREIVLNTQPAGFIGCSQAIKNFDKAEEIRNISAPALVMVGENDPGTPVENARLIHNSLRSSELAVLPHAYHLSNIEAADEFNRRLMNFLAKL